MFLSTAAVLVLSAGMVVGRLSAHFASPGLVKPATEKQHEWLPETLGLTPDQDQKMKAVWDDVGQQMNKSHEKQRNLDKDRDAAIKALLSPEQSKAYDQIFTDYHAHRTDLEKEREQLLRTGNDRSRALLTPDQQVKWDAMNKQMHDHDHPRRGGPGGPGGPGGGRNRGGPSTRPDASISTTGPV
jgi:hypothetical protein